MIRRLVLTGAALLAAGALTVPLAGCSTFSRNDAAASVNGTELSTDSLGAMLESDLTGQLVGSSARGGLAETKSARSLLGAWILLTAMEQDGLVPIVDRTTVEASLADQFGDLWAAAPADLRQLVVLNSIVNTAVGDGTISQDQAVAALNAANVYVDPRYGAWQPATISVDPLG